MPFTWRSTFNGQSIKIIEGWHVLFAVMCDLTAQPFQPALMSNITEEPGEPLPLHQILSVQSLCLAKKTKLPWMSMLWAPEPQSKWKILLGDILCGGATESKTMKTNSLMTLSFYSYFNHHFKNIEPERTFLNTLTNKSSVFKQQLHYEMEISCHDQAIWLI